MKRFIEGEDRGQGTLLPEHLDDYAAENNPVRVIDVFVGELDLAGIGFERVHGAGMLPVPAAPAFERPERPPPFLASLTISVVH
jgi:hypothetical protein